MKRTFSGMFVLVLLATALVLGGNAAQAHGSFYFGAGITSSKLNDIVLKGTDFPDIDNASWKAFIGFRPIRLFAVEVDYLDLGSSPTVPGSCTDCCMQVCKGTYRSDAHAFAAYALGFLPIPVPFLDVFGKAGLARWKLNGTSEFGYVTFSDRGTDFAWGIGVQTHISMFGARLEYESFNIRNTSGAKVASLSVFLKF